MSTEAVDEICTECGEVVEDYVTVRYRAKGYPNVRIRISDCCDAPIGWVPDSKHYGDVDVDRDREA